MDNKKLLNFLLKDLNELDELFTEKENGDFDQLETEFILTRVKGAKKLVQILTDRENSAGIAAPEKTPEHKNETQHVIEKTAEPVLKTVEDVPEPEPEIKVEMQEPAPVPVVEIPAEPVFEAETIQEEVVVEKDLVEAKNETPEEDLTEMKEEQVASEKEVELDEPPAENAGKRLGDSFLIEKSVNDLMGDESGKLEHKLSNRPVTSIQSAINLNDRFQYIRELFEGSADTFSKTVEEIDKMENLKEAVNYMQQNFKWKKNEISLKFINLVKRRFPNE